MVLDDIERMRTKRKELILNGSMFKSDEEKFKHFLSVIPATTKAEQTKAIKELAVGDLLALLELSHNMVVAAVTYVKQTKRRHSLFSVFTSSKKDEQRGIEDLSKKSLVDLKELKLRWQVSFCEAYATSSTTMETSPEVFFRRLERVWSNSIPLSLDDYLPEPKLY